MAWSQTALIALFMLVAGLIWGAHGCISNTKTSHQLHFTHESKSKIRFDTIAVLQLSAPSIGKLSGLSKVARAAQNTYILLTDDYSEVFLADSSGKVSRRIAALGKGPGEFGYIPDFCVLGDGRILVLGDSPVQVGEFENNGNHVRTITLPWAAGESIDWFEGGILVGSFVQYGPDRDRRKDPPLPYDEWSFLVLYDWNLGSPQKFLLRPSPALRHTEGLFHLPRVKFAPFAVAAERDRLFAMLQEGFYRIEEYDARGVYRGAYEVFSDEFVPVVPSQMPNLRAVGYNQEVHGRLIASHSAPNLLVASKNWLVVRMTRPYDNYYPQYAREPEPKYYYDFFQIRAGALMPVATGVESDLWLVGVVAQDDIFFFTRRNCQRNEVSRRVFVVRFETQ